MSVMVPIQRCKTYNASRQDSVSRFAAYNWVHKADLFRSTDWQFALAEELDHVWHALERLAELAENVATIVADDLYM